MATKTTERNLNVPVGTDKIGVWALEYDTENWNILDHVAMKTDNNGGPIDNTFSGSIGAVNGTFSGNISAANLSGNGANITNVNASTVSGFTVGKSVPNNAIFTDTLNTTGSTNTTGQIYLVGATTQATNPQTYSRSGTYVTANGTLTTPYITATGTSMNIDCGAY